MLRFAIRIGCVSLLALGLQSASGFSLMGPPNVSWQSPTIGYNLYGYDIGAPHDLGEEYRWNTPIIYYTYDQNFLDYFGSNGVFAVDQAVAILNGLTNFSRYSAGLNEVPLETRRVNYSAQTLHLFDIKTMSLAWMVETLGLADSERFVWTIRTRDTQPGLSCPFMEYGIIKLSFDPLNWQPSSYVNNALYSYIIQEICSGPNPLAVTIPFSVDPLAVESLPVASFFNNFYINYGQYVNGLTRDDVGGLRYIYGPTNLNWESISSDSQMFYTNVPGGQQLLLSSNLTLLAAQALTNNAAALQALYPTLNIVATTNIYTNIWVTNLTAYFTNLPYSPVGSPPTLVFATNLTLTVQTWYHHTFNNVVTFQPTNQFGSNVWTVVPLPDILSNTGPALITVQTTTVTNLPYAPSGTPPITNITTLTYLTNQVVGDYFILSSNLCGIAITALQATVPITVTNIVNSATNLPAGTTNAQSFSQAVIDTFYQHVFTYYPVNCLTTNTALKQGIDKFMFVKVNYDSLVGRYFQPVTNLYTLVTVTNSRLFTNWYERVVTKPDFLFTAEDTTTSFGSTLSLLVLNGSSFNASNENARVFGPGNIDPGVPPPPNYAGTFNIVFSKAGPVLLNIFSTNFILGGLSESTARTNFIWGSFDGTTNAPVVYPIGSSIMNLEAQILYQIVTPFLSDGQVGRAYPPTPLEVAGGTPPYSWSWSAGVPALPPGLSLSGDGVITGTPTAAGTYVFNVTVTGADSQTTTRTLQLIIGPP